MTGTEQFRRVHHYLPRSYLRGWENDRGELYVYRLLVSHERVPVWQPTSPGATAYREHLYTRVEGDQLTDEFERWLDRKIEGPAAESLHKARTDAKMTPDDWRHLIRYVAALDVRTPARYVEMTRRWEEQMPALLNQTLTGAVATLEEARQSGTPLPHGQHPNAEALPLRVTSHIEPGADLGELRAEVVVGRGLWLFQIRHILDSTVKALLRHRWVILRAPAGLEWITSDNPVVRLNYYSDGNYDFQGGWGRKGCDIICPVSPTRLLFTTVGTRRPPIAVPDDISHRIQNILVEHAHREIYSRTASSGPPSHRPRRVDAEMFRAEQAEWDDWHEQQTGAELPAKDRANE
jgi:hypothetical protein